MRRTAVLVLSSLVLSAGVSSLGPAARAATDAAVPMPLTAFRDIVVDDAHGHVFLTGGGSNGVVVRDLAGAAVTTITNQPGAAQMALSEDGSTLYVALTAGDAVSAISTTTLAETARYATGASTCPATVAVTSGKVWFGYACNGGSGNLGVIDPAGDPTPTVTLAVLPTNTFYEAPGLQASASKPGLLVAGEFGSSPAKLRLIDVSSGTPVLGAFTSPGSNLQDFALTSDGTHVITASGSPYEHHAYLTTDLSADGVFGSSNPYPNAVATSATGLVAGGRNGSPTVTVYRADASIVRSYNWSSSTAGQGMSNSLPAAGLAFNATGTRLYVVTTDYLGGAVQLHVLVDPGKAVSTIALTKPTGATINHAFTLTGHLTSNLAIPAGKTVTVQRDTGAGGPVTNLPSRTTGTGGAFTITDTVSKRGAYGYRASWAGDATHAAATVRVTFSVRGYTSYVTITTGAGPYAYGARPLVVAHLGTTKLRSLRIYAQPYGGTKTLWKSGTVDSHGNLSGYYTLSRRTTFTVTFAGDDTYEPRSYAKALLAHAKVASALQGYYGTSGSYRLFRTSVDPALVVTVAPNNAGTCVSFVAQRYYSGAWHNATSLSCEVLDAYSRAGAVLATSAPAGTRYRVRGTFKGNSRNVATNGSWQYLRFTT